MPRSTASHAEAETSAEAVQAPTLADLAEVVLSPAPVKRTRKARTVPAPAEVFALYSSETMRRLYATQAAADAALALLDAVGITDCRVAPITVHS